MVGLILRVEFESFFYIFFVGRDCGLSLRDEFEI